MENDIDFKLCLTSGFVGFDLEPNESEEELKEMSDLTLDNIQSQLLYWSMIIKNISDERVNNGRK